VKARVILGAETGVAERPEETALREGHPDARRGGGPPGLEGRLRSWKLFPHEIVAVVFVAFGIVILERLPVTYPREGLVLAAYLPALGFAVSTTLLLALREAWRRWRGRPRTYPFAIEAILLLRAAAVLLPVLSVHFLLKSFIWLVNPRTWDAFLWDADRFVHLGLSPSILLTGAFTSGAFLRFLDVVYSNFYFLLIVVSVPVLLVLPDLNRRMGFLAAYTFMWIAGSLIYLAFPSWGPVFVVSDVFAESLRHMPATVRVQQVLFGEISSLVNDPLALRYVRFGCVAAFPSLHLAVVTVFTAASRRLSRRWFLANVVIVFLMLIGSVVTGYHYLVDGWAGIVLGLGAFRAGSRLFLDKSGEEEAPPASGSSSPALLQRP